jgi:hypothetical protein
MLIAVGLLVVFVYLFCREIKRDRLHWEEQDRLGDEHIMREIEKFKREKGLK